jgi:hypothetical protein
MYDLIMGSGERARLSLLSVMTAAIIGLSLPASAVARKNPCAPGVSPFGTKPATETSALDPSVTGMFALLRRPAGPEDQVPPFNPLSEDLGYQLRSYLPAYVRQIERDPDGGRYFLIPGFERGFPIPPAECLPRGLRRHRAQFVAEQRQRESRPVYCIDELDGHRPQYIDVSCQPFAAVQSGARLIATAGSTSDVLELAPDGVATVRLLYRSGSVVAAPVINNVFSFIPPQHLLKEAVVRAKRFERELRKEPRASRPHALRRLAKFFTQALNAVRPQTVEWLSANGQPLRIFRPKTEAGALSVGPGSVITIH